MSAGSVWTSIWVTKHRTEHKLLISMTCKAFLPIHLPPSSHLNVVVWRGYGCHNNCPGGRWLGWSASSEHTVPVSACVWLLTLPSPYSKQADTFMNITLKTVFQLLLFNYSRQSPKLIWRLLHIACLGNLHIDITHLYCQFSLFSLREGAIFYVNLTVLSAFALWLLMRL